MSDREAFEKAYHKETGLCASWAPSNKGYTDVIAGMCYRIWQAAQAQAGDGEPVAVADNGVLNWIDGKQFDHESDLYTQPAVNQQLLEALKQILGWRELRSGANEVPIGRIEDLARAAIAAAQEVGNE